MECEEEDGEVGNGEGVSWFGAGEMTPEAASFPISNPVHMSYFASG